MAKTIKQIADEIGVSKTAIRKKIANLGLQLSLRKIGNQFAVGFRFGFHLERAVAGER